MMNKGKTAEKRNLGIPLLTAAVIWLAVFFTLYLNYTYSLPLLAVIVIAILTLEKKGIIDRTYIACIKERKLFFLAVLIGALLLPLALSGKPYALHIGVLVCVYAILALGLNFQMGSADMVNFAPAAFFGIGAYTTGVLTMKLGISPWLGVMIAAAITCVLGGFVGAPTLRTKGYYLSLVTMALQLIFSLVIVNIKAVGGPNGMPGLPGFTIGSFSFHQAHDFLGLRLPYQANYLYLALLLLAVLLFVAYRVNLSSKGLALNNIGQDEVVAGCLGININKEKLFAFCIGGAFCGIAGAFYGHYMSFVGPDDYDFSKSLMIICMVILGGMDNPLGVAVGAFLLIGVNEKLRDFADYQMLIYGLILMIALLLRPQGLLPKRVRNYELIFHKKASISHDKKDETVLSVSE
ncbi:MAG: branched-chain amino acid ABC transporter permease [Peptococcaceae bacterium]|jgi:branched-chain amino acid transport system permease protein|nr:branched-chain amino acid ABC transporter permease [Peptococcaceae bacterium]